jgi:hypothetical protein
MTPEYRILRERIERFGSMITTDEFGSHDENAIELYAKVTDAEARELSLLEVQHAEGRASTAV